MQPTNQLPEKEACFCSQRDEMNVCLASLAGQTWIFPIKKGQRGQKENEKLEVRRWRETQCLPDAPGLSWKNTGRRVAWVSPWLARHPVWGQRVTL